MNYYELLKGDTVRYCAHVGRIQGFCVGRHKDLRVGDEGVGSCLSF